MTTVILVAHIIVSIILVIVVLMQRSEGGGLGIGGGGGGGGGAGGGLMSGRGVAGALVRTTMIFGAIFFVSSLTLTVIATQNSTSSDAVIPVEIDTPGETGVPDDLGVGDLDDILNADTDLLDDPLAASPAQPVPANDPLAEPDETGADPQ
ncbi:MAG: preprotein translocase subunit SecG [Henriciella sp.]|jgi:preprotein translocase subunit SecG